MAAPFSCVILSWLTSFHASGPVRTAKGTRQDKIMAQSSKPQPKPKPQPAPAPVKASSGTQRDAVFTDFASI